jgi:hypothetical protein
VKIRELIDFEPSIGDIVEFETDPDTVVEGVIVAETEDGYVFEFSSTGLTELMETCTYGKYYCSTDKKYKCRQGPKQDRDVTEDVDRAEAQANYMQGECMILAVAINQYNPKRYPIGYIWEYNMSAGAPDIQLDDDEWNELSPEEQEEISKDISRRSIVHAYVRDRETNEYIDARGRHRELPNLWGRLGQTRFEEFPGSARELINITTHGDWDEAAEEVSFKRGQPAFDSLAGTAGVKRALDYAIKYLGVTGPDQQGMSEAHPNSKIYDKCWDGYKKVPGKKRGEKGSCVPESSGYIPRNSKEAKDPRWSSALTDDVTTHTMRDQISKFFPTTAPKDGQEQIKEAEYQGRKVPLGKPMAGDVKKSKVYVRNDKGNVVKVNFGDPNMRIKKSNPKNRKSFRARHNCANPGPRWKARYWSCKAW